MRTGSRKTILLVLFAFISAGSVANANSPTIFEVRQPLAMSGDQPIKKDYYINSGSESGLKPGYVVTVTRRLSLHDKFRNQSVGDLVVPVGRLKIIHTQTGLSVGRMYSLYTRENVPVLDYDFIMVGDRLDLATAKMESPQQKRRKKTIKKKVGATAADRSSASMPPSYRPPVPTAALPKKVAVNKKSPEPMKNEKKKEEKPADKIEQVSKKYRPQPVDGPILQ